MNHVLLHRSIHRKMRWGYLACFNALSINAKFILKWNSSHHWCIRYIAILFSRRCSLSYFNESHSHEMLAYFHNTYKQLSILNSVSRDSFSLNCFRIAVYNGTLSELWCIQTTLLVRWPLHWLFVPFENTESNYN